MDLTKYSHEKVSDHVIRVVDALDVAAYLIVGEERAVLLDTCFGFGDVKAAVEAITPLPLTVVLTHGHCDHICGVDCFDHAYMNLKDMPIFEEHRGIAFRRDSLVKIHGLELDESEFRVIPDGILEDLPEDTDMDLGGVTLKLLMAPGHTPGSLCALIEEDRVLIIGDVCDDNVLLFEDTSSTVSEYMTALQRIKDMEGSYDLVLGNHGAFVFEKAIIDNVLECCRKILAHEDGHILTNMLGHTLYSACAVGDDMLRLDGKQGNVLYREDKAV